MVGPKVGFDDVLLTESLIRGPDEDDTPLVKDLYPIGDLQHQRHVVIDEKDGAAKIFTHLNQERPEFGRLSIVEAGSGLVHEKDLWTPSQRSCQLDSSLAAVGYFRNNGARQIFESKPHHQLLYGLIPVRHRRR
jgi:hypothetical protein